jgi:prepilin-type N-terminal cleavage/methylation domain-containing protein
MLQSRGFSLIEALLVVSVIGIAIAVSIPALARIRSASRTAAAARQVAVSFQALRWRSVAEAKVYGWQFRRDGDGWEWMMVQDGNGNGLRSAEIRDGTDRVISGPHRIERWVEQVRPGFPDLPELPAIPPRRGSIQNLDDPVKFGRSDLISFSPGGSASSGTLYLTDGETLFAVVLFGPTARTRVWRYDSVRHRWVR